jgi:uncharacterized protein (DUF1501 family)
MPALMVSGDAEPQRSLVVIFLRGGADGLSLVPPVGDDGYHRARPQLRIAADQGLRLNELFALNPSLHELHGLFQRGMLSVIHAAGSEDESRSHFEAQDLMEHGGLDIAGGWVGRWLRSRQDGDPRIGGTLAAISLGDEVQESLRASPTATALRALDELDRGPDAARLHRQLASLYAGDTVLAEPAISALAAAERISELHVGTYRPRADADYAGTADGEIAVSFSHDLMRVAQLLKARVGIVAACIDLGNWDSHFIQAQLLEPRMRALSKGLGAFAHDLGDQMAQTTVVVMSEFGRRVRENASLGTDHGHGGAMFVLGGGTPGGMHCAWPGLTDGYLDGPGDLPVVHNYRDVLASVLARHGSSDLSTVFPGYALQPMAV